MDLGALFDIRGKSALVTGGTSGIGRMIAEGLVSAGARVWICARKAHDVEAVAQELSALGECRGIAADLSTDEGLAALKAALAGEEALHILVNNAGATWVEPIDAFSREGFDTVLDVNVTMPFMVIQAMLPLLRKAAKREDPARIINISSAAVRRPSFFENYSYSASKGGLEVMSTHLGTVLVKEHITVNCIAPGLFRSRLTEPLMNFDDPAEAERRAPPLGRRLGEIEDIASAVIYLSARSGAWITGQVLSVSGGTGTIRTES